MIRFSWIVAITWLYFISILLYSLQDAGLFWDHYFWIDNSLMGIAALSFNFVRRKTAKEKAHIIFLVALKVFNLFYYITGILLHTEKWMDANIFFLTVVALSTFTSFIKYRSWQVN